MGTAKTETLLPIDIFAQICGVQPLHFNQVVIEEAPVCESVWFQYHWQGAQSREEVATAIRSAEDDLDQFLGFPVAPKWYEDLPVPLSVDDIGGRIVLPKARYIVGGRKTTTLIEADRPIVYTSIMGSSTYLETATITCDVGAVTDPLEIAICYPNEDITDWQIRPIKVSISGGIATITCQRHQLVQKNLLEAYSPNSVDGTDNANFLTLVDVYRIYNNPATQALIQHTSCVCTSGCNGCLFDLDTGCIVGYKYHEGIVDVSGGTWNEEDSGFDNLVINGRVTNIRTYFKAGYPLDNDGSMNHNWALAVSRLALSRMTAPLCPCPQVQKNLEYWTEDLGKSTSVPQKGSLSHKIPHYVQNCPWGLTRGAIFAYTIAANQKMPQGK